ncbi:MAG: cache domain-containing protein, partial [Campylobacterota bacterium]|nr:cache domain-containing protein [Campylobacterota bacterium]
MSIKIKFFSIFTIVFISFMSVIVYHEYEHITNSFVMEHQDKNDYIKKNANAFLNMLKKDISTKSDFIVNNKKITEAFYLNDRDKLYSLVNTYYEKQKQLNPYLKIMTFRSSDGSTFLRVHKPKMYGDKLNKKRKIIIDTNKYKKRHYGFEIGKLKMTYRVVTPIFHKNKHIGLIEIGIEPEYIIDKLKNTYLLEHALLVNKSNLSVNINNKKEIKYFDKFALIRGTEFFDTSISGIDINKNPNKFINYKNNFYILETGLNFYDHNKNIAAKLLFASKVENIVKRDKALIENILLLISLMIVLFIMLNIVINKFLKIQDEQLKIISKQSSKINTIFNGASNIIVLTDGEIISKANKAFFDFFDQYSNIEEFTKDYSCVCDKFEESEEEGYINGKYIEGEVWTRYILTHPEGIYKATIKKGDTQYHFLVKVQEIQYDNEILDVIDLSDITKEVEQRKEIEKQSKFIIDQTKMAALGEMISNIAHQWRQPLSVISTSASGMKIQSELKLLDDKILEDNCDLIVANSNHLSQTIDDFRDFIKGDKVKHHFNIKDIIDKSLNIIQASLKTHHIEQILTLEDIEIENFENELIQALNNIINNSKDALIELDSTEKLIFIKCYKDKEFVVIEIQDNAGGIPENIIEKIFEPYFTTKHQSQGTGLGLYMTHKIIHESMKGSIKVKNIEYEYNSCNYKGAMFKI